MGRDCTSDVANLQGDIKSVIACMGKTLQLAFKHPKDYWFLDSFTHLPIELRTIISRVPSWSVTYSGVSISSDLSWATHIDIVCCKAKQQVGLLHWHFHAGSPSCKAQLYKSLVLPILDYCSSLWDPNYSIHVNKLESVQKLAARFVTGKWHDNYAPC